MLLIVALGVLLLDLVCAAKFKEIAELKGWNGKSYFWWTFFLSVVGMMMVVALPDRKLIEALSHPSGVMPSKTSMSPDNNLPEL